MTPAALSFGALLVASAAQPALPSVETADPAALRQHCGQLLEALEKRRTPLPAETADALRALLREGAREPDLFAGRVQELLDPFCLIGVTINPESRVKAARGPATAELVLERERVVLIKVHNDAGVTHALTVSGPQLRAAKNGSEEQWLDAAVSSEPPLSKTLSGQKLEYVVLRLTARQAGKREATLKFDVGQGTQDLGFRAEVPVLFSIRRP